MSRIGRVGVAYVFQTRSKITLGNAFWIVLGMESQHLGIVNFSGGNQTHFLTKSRLQISGL